jgi:predicted nucleotidyltransferase
VIKFPSAYSIYSLIRKEYDIIGVTLCGSYARGHWKPGSDVDISFLVKSEASLELGQFSREFEGVVLDYGIDTPKSLASFLVNENDLNYRGMVAHSLSTGSRIIYDPLGEAESIRELARKVRDELGVVYDEGKRGQNDAYPQYID